MQTWAVMNFDVCVHGAQDQPRQHWPNVLMLVTRRVPSAMSSLKISYFHDVVSCCYITPLSRMLTWTPVQKNKWLKKKEQWDSWCETTLMRDDPDEKPHWWEMALIKKPLWWEMTLMRNHSDERWPWWETTLMRDNPDEKPLWWDMALTRIHSDERWPWWEMTLMRNHSGERWPWWETTLMKDDPDEKPLWWKRRWWETTLMRDDPDEKLL